MAHSWIHKVSLAFLVDSVFFKGIMTRKEWISGLSKEDAVFRMFGKEMWSRRCDECVFYKPDEYGKYKCANPAQEDTCYQEFEEWLNEDMAE